MSADESRFALVGGGIGVMPDPGDNPMNHVVPHSEAGVEISFEVVNAGTGDGQATVGIEIDDTWVADWVSSTLAPGASEVGRASLGRLNPGEHTVLIYVNPGAGSADHETNTFNLD